LRCSRDGDSTIPLGGAGSAVEVDETYIGRVKGVPVKRGFQHKNAVLSLVERGGRVRSFHVDKATVKEVAPIVTANVSRETRLMTDESNIYTKLGREFAGHGVVNHKIDEYVRGDDHTNTVEGYFSIFKRGIIGVYQHCSEKHLHRYVAEFDFRYNNRSRLGIEDAERADRALKGVVGKRLTYRGPAKL